MIDTSPALTSSNGHGIRRSRAAFLVTTILACLAWAGVARADSPSVTSVSVPANGTYTTGENLDFVVNFDQSVIVTGTPKISLTVGASSPGTDYLSGSGTTALVFRYTVQPGDSDADGVALGALSLNGATIRNAGSEDALLGLNSVGSTTGVLVSAPPAPVVVVPTMTEWAMILLSGLLALFGFATVNRRAAREFDQD